MTTFHDWLTIGMFIPFVLVLQVLSEIKRFLREGHDDLIQIASASQESQRTLVEIEKHTLAIRRLLEKQAEDPAERFLSGL
jgi:hypothetical protein